MMIGIISAWIFIKKRVYICPTGAACPGSFNPDNSFLQDIRTVMQYWLHIGMLIFGVGLVKLVAHQSWSAMRQRGNTIDMLALNMGAMRGSASDAASLLLLQRGNRSLGVFVLTHIAIITAISLVVGKSITTVTDTGSVELMFDYPMNISILNVDQNQDANQGPGLGTVKYGPTWAWLSNSAANLSDETFSGTFIIQDSRAEYAVNAQPSGQQIGGSVSCVDPTPNIFVNTTDFGGILGTGLVNITYLPPDTIDVPGSVTLQLDPTNLAIGKLIGQYIPTVTEFDQNATFIWFTIANGIIPNAMEVPQSAFNGSFWDMNSLFIGLCEHTIAFSTLPQNDALSDGIQYINPSQPTVYLPPGDDFWEFQSQWSPEIELTPEHPVAFCHDGCMWSAVWNTLLTWWGLEDNLPQVALGMDIYCYGGVLSPAGGDMNQTCPSLDGEIWNKTLALVLDAMIQTYPRVGNTSQRLLAQTESIGTWQWWLQGIIPLSAFILYVACLTYTVTVDWVGESMKELDLLEVVNATHVEEERLTKSVMVGGDLKKPVGRLGE